MKKLISYTDFYRAIAGVLFSATTAVVAQTPAPAAVAVPSQFATAHTAFLSNAGAPALGRDKEGSTMAYESVYTAIAADGRYHLTGTPAEAELNFEISIGVVSSVTKGDSIDSGYLRLAVYDVKTHCLLWNIDEPVKGAFRASTFQKNIGEATEKLMVDLHSLSSGKQP